MFDPITRLNAALEGCYRIERQLGEGGAVCRLRAVGQRWKELLHHFYDPFPVLEHYAPLSRSQS